MRTIIGICLLGSLIPFLAKSQTPFQPVNPITGNYYISKWIDYDNDGDMDLFVGGPSGFVMHINNGSDNFNTNVALNITATYSYGNTDWGDYDCDGDLDLLLCSTDGVYTQTLLYQNNKGSFTPIDITPNHGAFLAKWIDYDNDGDLDILIYEGAYVVFLYENKGTGYPRKNVTFERTNFDFNMHFLHYCSFDVGDYNNDGFQDIVISGIFTTDGGYDNHLCKVFKNNGNKTFTFMDLPLWGTDGVVSWGDIDNDNDLDIVLNGRGGSRVYKNAGNDNFILTNSSLPDNYASHTLLDFDNDGKLDVLFLGPDIGLYKGAGNGSFTYFSSGTINTNASSLNYSNDIDVADYNKDGKLDFAYANRGVYIYI